MNALETAARSRLGDLPAPDSPMVELLPELRRLGREDLGVARLIEPHLDAVRILHQAGRAAEPGALYGVWASESASPVRLRGAGRSAALKGTKQFCGGAGICDRALVTARDVEDRRVLVDVDLRDGRRQATVAGDGAAWATAAFAGTTTWSVDFRDHEAGTGAVVGAPGFYLSRPGFWIGALGPVAVWAGGADGLVDAAEALGPGDAHQQAELGEMRALQWAMGAQLGAAAEDADRRPDDTAAARRTALVVRHLVERQSSRIVELFGRRAGPRSLAFDGAVARRLQELALSVRQVHLGQELEQLGSDEGGGES